MDGVTSSKKKLYKLTYEDIFYRPITKEHSRRAREQFVERVYGFPMVRGGWCNSDLKMAALRISKQNVSVLHRGTQAKSKSRVF